MGADATIGLVVNVYFPSGASVRAELATTPDQIQRGLMFRASVPDGTGMLFDMGRTGLHRFWMQNVRVPLDMIFLDEQHVVVGVRANAQPFDTTLSGYHSRYVLEVSGGWCARNGAGVGQRAEIISAPRG